MTILNMTYGQGNPYQPFHLNAISDLAVTGGDTEATITWTDPGNLVVDGQTLATWVSTKLVRKVGSAPTDSSDGTLVVEETVADTYSVSGYTDTGLTNGTTYYYGAFAVADNGTEIISNTVNVTPSSSWQPGVNTMLYLPLNGDVVDYSSYSRTFTVYGSSASVGTPVFDTLPSGKQVANFIATAASNSNWFAFTDNVTDIPNSGNLTVSFWVNRGGQSTNYYQGMVDFRNNSSYTWMTGVNPDGKFLFHGASALITNFIPIVGTWYNMVCVVDNGTYSIYKDGDASNPLKTGSYTYGSSSSKVSIGAFYDGGSPNSKSEAFNGKIGDVIVENVAWTQQEISDYFDQTKGDYGIS